MKFLHIGAALSCSILLSMDVSKTTHATVEIVNTTDCPIRAHVTNTFALENVDEPATQQSEEFVLSPLDIRTFPYETFTLYYDKSPRKKSIIKHQIDIDAYAQSISCTTKGPLQALFAVTSPSGTLSYTMIPKPSRVFVRSDCWNIHEAYTIIYIKNECQHVAIIHPSILLKRSEGAAIAYPDACTMHPITLKPNATQQFSYLSYSASNIGDNDGNNRTRIMNTHLQQATATCIVKYNAHDEHCLQNAMLSTRWHSVTKAYYYTLKHDHEHKLVLIHTTKEQSLIARNKAASAAELDITI